MNPPRLSARTVRELARQSGVDLGDERAAALLPELEVILDADARVAALRLGALRPLGPGRGDDPGD